MQTKINGIEIEFQPEREIFGMMGGWIGQISVNQTLLKGNFLHQPYVIDDGSRFLFFARYEYGKMRNDVRFSLVIFDTTNRDVWIYKHKFKALFIESVKENQITFYKAFQQIKSLKSSIIFDLNDFQKEMQ